MIIATLLSRLMASLIYYRLFPWFSVWFLVFLLLSEKRGDIMAKEMMREETIKEIFRATPHLLKFPGERMWIDYDKEANVLYINFKRPQKATDSEMLKSGILIRYRGDQIVGLTIWFSRPGIRWKLNDHSPLEFY